MTRAPVKKPDGPQKVECIVPDVALGDERVLYLGDQAEVSADLAELLKSKKQVKYV